MQTTRRFTIPLILVMLASLLGTGVQSALAAGATYYVSMTGSDTNSGSSTSPWRTIQKAVNTAPAGSTISVAAGSYSRTTISRSQLTVVASGKVVTGTFTVTGSNNTVRGFTITDPGKNAGIIVQGNYNLFLNNEIYHTMQDGIWFFGHDNTFRGNYIHDILDPSIGGDPHVDCFQTWGYNWDTYNVLFDRNTCNHTRTSGSNQITMIERATTALVQDITFRNNIFIMHDSGYSPMNIVRKSGQGVISGIKVLNNTFYNTTGAGQEAVKLTSISNGLVEDNVSIGYGKFATITGGTVSLAKNVASGPYGMVDYPHYNFRLTSGSPLINAGVSDGVPTDFAGVARPQGGSYDIGAFEYLP